MSKSRYAAIAVMSACLVGAVVTPSVALDASKQTHRAECEQAVSDVLEYGQTLHAGERLTSPNRNNELVVEHSGLSLYVGGERVWTTPGVKFGKSVRFTPTMDLLVEGRDHGNSYVADTSDRARRAGASVRLQVTDAGTAQIVSTNDRGTVLWRNGELSERSNLKPGESLPIGESPVSPDGNTKLEHRALADRRSRLVISSQGRDVWHSPAVTFPQSAQLTQDGDLVLNSALAQPGASHVIRWSSETSPFVSRLQTKEFEVVARDKGKVQLVAYKPSYGLIWENGQRKF